MKLSRKTLPKIKKATNRYNYKGNNGFNWDNGMIVFDNPGKRKREDEEKNTRNGNGIL